jgi:hypothetical protein
VWILLLFGYLVNFKDLNIILAYNELILGLDDAAFFSKNYNLMLLLRKWAFCAALVFSDNTEIL